MSWKRFLPLLLVLILQGCASPLVIKVDAITSTNGQEALKHYYLKSGLKEVKEDDLYFIEFSRYVNHGLKQQGYSRTANEKEAQLVIKFSYGVTSGSVVPYTYSRPLYEYDAGDIITYVETTTDPQTKQTTKTVRTIHVPPRQHLVGSILESGSIVEYSSYMLLEASAKDSDKIAWRTAVKITEQSGDLRLLMPYLAHAATPHLGKNSGVEQTIKVKQGDVAVEAFKQAAMKNGG